MQDVFDHYWAFLIVTTVIIAFKGWRNVQARIDEDPALAPGYRRLFIGYAFWLSMPWAAIGIAQLTGGVTSPLGLVPHLEDPVALSWWGTLAGLLLLSGYWIFLAGGAETLARHPGLPMVPVGSPKRIRRSWVLATGSQLVVFVFAGQVATRIASSADDSGALTALPKLFPLLFLALWLGGSYLLASASGWGALAEHYASSRRPEGPRLYFRSANGSGGVGYKRLLTLGTGREAMSFAVLFPFRFGHPPLFVPWSDVSAHEVRAFIATRIELRFAKAPEVSLTVEPELAHDLFSESGDAVKIVRLETRADAVAEWR